MEKTKRAGQSGARLQRAHRPAKNPGRPGSTTRRFAAHRGNHLRRNSRPGKADVGGPGPTQRGAGERQFCARGGHPSGNCGCGLTLDRNSCGKNAGGRQPALATHRGAPAIARGRPGRSPGQGGTVHPPVAGRSTRPKPADWLLSFPGSDRRGQNRAGQSPGRVPLRRRTQHGAGGHVRVYGKTCRLPPDRSSPGLRGLRPGRSTHRSGAPIR